MTADRGQASRPTIRISSAARPKNIVYFNELNERVNQKIAAAN
jgi:hypothetical protein